MPPKKPAADFADPPAPSSSEAAEEAKTDAAALRKLTAHPSTAIMVKEALKALDTRKGVSSPAIQNYIKQKYPSVDLVRLKHFVRKALNKGLETGTLVRPANSTVTTGAKGKFRLAPKVKEAKPKAENVDPNEQNAAKDGAKKPKKTGTTKKKDTANEEAKSPEVLPKRSKKEKEAIPKAAPAKKPKAKKAAEKVDLAVSDSAKTKVAKTTNEAKAGNATRSKAAKAGSDTPAAKATGKRGKKTAE
ncbi:linker histone H1M [Etheostoma spectabile]|uniref:linker histone H1M n=1 Tax=Etheostoma spectabile TaxID=54343 RepID=UPI0013AF0E79|nr:histone H1-like [Etheostoma spectabile]